MTPPELRALAYEFENDPRVIKPGIWPDLARLCAEMGEALELLRHEATTIHHPEYPSTLKSNHAAATVLAKLAELKP